MKKVSRKIVSAVTALALTFQFVCIEGVFNGSVIASSYVNGKATVTLGDIDVDVQSKLEDNGDGSFNLTVDLGSALSANDESTNRLVSEDGYYVAPIAGRYLVEIWGGSGAAGGNSIEYNPMWTGILGKGGSSGAGGHVYGIVELNRGDVLWYEVGGNGAQEESWMSGGGANSGGNSLIAFKTGGGGGYSAVYYFPGSDFKSDYLDGNGNLAVSRLTADDHNSRYIMIAGGGGGGGAGCLYHVSASAIAAPNGGAGGSMTSPTVTLDSSYPVAGVVYCGGNGTSSGKDTSYIGIGGSAVPGESPATKHGWADTIDPNNWAGTFNRWSGYGGGGSSNLRGGGGGAGFAGGSGGVMRSVTISTNVGGGGGGSSFVASSLSAADTSLLLPDGNPSSNGGAVYISYLDKEDFPQYEDVELQFDISEYFDVSSGSSGVSVNGSEVTFSGIDLLSDDSATAVFTFTPKSNFLGGNKVPLFDSDFVLTAGSNNLNMTLSEDCSYVNVPITYDELTTYNLTYDSDSIPATISFSSLFTEVDTSDLIVGNEFIDTTSSFVYSVKKGVSVVSDPITAGTDYKSTVYSISYEIIPYSTNVAKIGSVATAQKVTKSASVTINDVSVLELSSTGGGTGGTIGDGDDDGIGMYVAKSLDFDGTDYVLGINMQVNKTYLYTDFTSKSFSAPDSYSFIAPASGYYAIQTWGAYGADGGNARSYDGNRTENGGSGGSGAYVCGYTYLNYGDSVTVLIGSQPTKPSLVQATTDDGRIALGIGGDGGGYSAITINDTYVTVAGGGGGGGGATIGLRGLTWDSGSSGGNASTYRTVTSADIAMDSSHIATSGENGYTGGMGASKKADGGSAGYTYVGLSTDVSGLPSSVSSVYSNMKSSNKPSDAGKNGACVITLLQSDDAIMTNDIVSIILNDFSGYSVSYSLSKYFEAGSIFADSVIDGENTEYTAYTKTTNSDGSTYVNFQELTPYFTLKQADTSIDDRYEIEVKVNADVNLHFTPKDGFLGGNDVPVLVPGGNDLINGMTLGHNSYFGNIPQQTETDYANVALNTSIFDDFTGTDKTIVLGDSVAMSTLFSSSVTSDPDDWTGEFVTVTPLDNSGSVSPTEKTVYYREVKIEADKQPEYAIVAGAATSETITKSATVSVELSVTYSLTNLTSLSDNPSRVDINDTLNVGLGTADGYTYPETVSVKVGGVELDSTEYSYDSSKGSIIVPAEQVTDNIVITAVGVAQKYKIHLAYQTYNNGEFSDVMPDGWPKEFYEGESIQVAIDAVEEVVPDTVPGYEFSWTWTTEDGKACDEMPARDLYIIGSYEANVYELTINYYEKDTTNALAEPYTFEYHYGEDYYVESPDIDTYVPLTLVVSGTMDDDETNDTINVYYEKMQDEVWVQFVATDGSTLIDSATGDELVDYKSGLMDVGDSYNYTMPVVTGYTPDIDTISGNMVEGGVYVKVTYSPNTYELTLDPDGGDIGTTSTSRIVKYNDIFSHVFDLTEGTDSYEALPIPVKLGYVFTGWYLDGDTETPLSSDSVVIPVDASDMSTHTLKAGWEPIKTEVTVEYVFEDETTAIDSKTIEAIYGVNYDIPSPVYDDTNPTEWTELRGYTPDLDSVSGVGGIENVNEKVTYVANEYTLIIKYLDKDDNPLVDISGNTIEDYVQTIKFNESYSVDSPDPDTIPDMIVCTDPVVQGKIDADALDDMVNDELVIKVYYSDSDYYEVTVEWGSLEFECDFDAYEWNPEDHTYIDSAGEPKNSAVFTPVTDENFIRIINNSSNSVDVVLQYNAYTGYESIVGTFENSEFNVAATGSHTEFLELSGTFNDHFISSITAGNCNVEISGGK